MSQLRRSGIFVEARLPQGFQLRRSDISCRADAAPTELNNHLGSSAINMPLLRSYQTPESPILPKRGNHPVAQVSKPAVSPVSKPAGRGQTKTRGESQMPSLAPNLSQRDNLAIARRFNAGTKPGGRKTIAQRFIAGFAHPGVTSPVRDERISVNVSTHPAGVGTARPHESNRDDLATSRRHPARASVWNIRHSCLGIDSSFAIRHSSFFAPLRLNKPFLFPPRVRTGS